MSYMKICELVSKSNFLLFLQGAGFILVIKQLLLTFMCQKTLKSQKPENSY